mmetsp:Transcript_21227/g.48763  ORF Transcript_21227/g.48763 Transcript_21227/m.48763 type:complete len:268 (-) Transcript_21227:1076-1879(-)
MIANAASPTCCCNSCSNGLPGFCFQTASQDPSSAASMAMAWAACLFASSLEPLRLNSWTSGATMFGACSNAACTFALWSLNRLAKAPAALSRTACSLSSRHAASGLNTSASTIRSLILACGAKFIINATAPFLTSTLGSRSEATDFLVTCALYMAICLSGLSQARLARAPRASEDPMPFCSKPARTGIASDLMALSATCVSTLMMFISAPAAYSFVKSKPSLRRRISGPTAPCFTMTPTDSGQSLAIFSKAPAAWQLTSGSNSGASN